MIAFLMLLAPAAAAAVKPADDCSPSVPDPKNDTIVICAPKPNGYRINPDVLEARRLKKKGDASRPRSPHEAYKDNSCATVGPMGCRGGPAIDLIAAAATAAEVAQRISKGQEVGSILVTDPHPSEYQLYLEAKKRREEREADVKAAKVKLEAERSASTVDQEAKPIQKQ